MRSQIHLLALSFQPSLAKPRQPTPGGMSSIAQKVNNEKMRSPGDIPVKNDPVTPAEDTWPYYHPRHP